MNGFNFLKICLAASLAFFFCMPSYSQIYDENLINEEEQVNNDDSNSSWDALSFSIMPVDIPDNKITVPDDPLSQSFHYFVQALADEQNDNIDNAINGFKKAIDASPDNTYIYQHAAQAALDSGRYEDAKKWTDYLIKKDSSTAQNWVLYGNSQWANENLAEAERAYFKALSIDPADTEALFQCASLISDDRPDLAMKFLNKYKSLRPEHSSEIDYRIAVLYNLKGNLKKTEEYLLKSVEENPYSSQAWYSLIELYEIKKDTESAVAAMESLALAEPGNVSVLKRLAETYIENDIDKADEYFHKIKEIDKSDSDACFWLSVNAENNGDYEEAAKQLEDSSALWSRPELLMRLSFYYTKSERYKEGVELLEKAHEKFPDNDDISYYMSLGLDDLKNYEKAYSVLDLLVRKKPENLSYRMALAQVCEKLDKTDEMEKHFKYILEKQPDNASVLNYLGYCLADRNIKLDEANQYIEKAVQLSPNDGSYADSLAWVNYRMGNIQKAKEEIIRAKNIMPKDFELWNHYGDIFNSTGNLQEAWKGWKLASLTAELGKHDMDSVNEKIKQAERRLPPESAAILRTAFYDKFIAHGSNYSSMAAIEAKAGGKKIKLNIIISFSAPDYLKITFLSPFFTPMGFAAVSGEDPVFSDLPVLPGMEKYQENMKSWLAVMLMDLRDFYMGRYNKANVKNWKKLNYVSEYGAKVKICKNSLPCSIQSARNKKINMEIKNYYFNSNYFFPKEIEFTVPHVKAIITIDVDKMKYGEENDFRDFVKMQP